MGILVEFNPDLALRNISEYKAGRRKIEECIPESLKENTTYEFLKEVSDSDIADLDCLLKQLTTPDRPLTRESVMETISSGDLLVARDTETGKIIGTVSLFRIPTLLGVDGCIENIVVHTDYRKQGIGRILMEMVFEKSRCYGWHKAEWTSGDYRTEAFNFYRKIPEVKYRPQTRYTKVL